MWNAPGLRSELKRWSLVHSVDIKFMREDPKHHTLPFLKRMEVLTLRFTVNPNILTRTCF